LEPLEQRALLDGSSLLGQSAVERPWQAGAPFDGPQAATVAAPAYPYVSAGAALDVAGDEPQAARQIRGSKFNDFDGDGIWDGNEPGIAGWTIYLDADRNGQLDSGETFTITDRDGAYAFDDPPAGTHYVEEVMLDGWLQTFPQQPAPALAAAASIHDEPVDGIGDAFNADDALIRRDAASEDRAIREFDVGFLAGRTLAEATLDLTLEPIDPGAGSSALLAVSYYAGNGLAELNDFSTPAIVVTYLGFGTTLGPVDFSLDFRDHLQASLNAGHTFFGIRIDPFGDSVPATRLTHALLSAPLDLGHYPHVVVLGASEILAGIDFGNLDVAAPEVTLAAPASTFDHTPSVIVSATDNDVLPDGTPVALDVDLNNDGDFLDAAEQGYTTSVLIGGAATFDVSPALADGTYGLRARVSDPAGNEGVSATSGMVVNSATVVGRHVFYNNSKWDGHAGFIKGDPAANEFDDGAIATDKTALLPGQTGTFANYTSYPRGINGIMVDVQGLADPIAVADGDLSEFDFRYGNDDTPDDWLPAPTPLEVTVRDIGGGVHRITFIWADKAIPNKNWVRVIVKEHPNTGLAADDVFYFGNTVGENTGDFRVDYSDAFDIIWPLLGTPLPIGPDHVADINRDGRIDYSDVFDDLWPNLSGPAPLKPIHAPAAPVAPLQSTDSVFNEKLSWEIELIWFDQAYGTSSGSDDSDDDPLEATAVDGVFSVYYEE
jgi:hypothetical protein